MNTEATQVEMPFAMVLGERLTEMPRDLYIPPQAMEVFLEAFEGPLDLLLYLIRLCDELGIDPIAAAQRKLVANAEKYPVDKARKSALLLELVVQNDWQQVLVFSRTKHGANKLAQYLEKAGVVA